jgi:hypothetical protein
MAWARRFRWMGISAAALCLLAAMVAKVRAQETHAADWRTASDAELKTVIPARAPVVTERIETEMTSASGITNGHGQFIAGVVLITAGYSAEGKYSHFFVTQVPLKIGNSVSLPMVHFYEAATGKPVGSVLATRIPGTTRVEQIRVWPPATHALIQIGRFGFSYQIGG